MFMLDVGITYPDCVFALQKRYFTMDSEYSFSGLPKDRIKWFSCSERVDKVFCKTKWVII